jgi:hypothetical protein
MVLQSSIGPTCTSAPTTASEAAESDALMPELEPIMLVPAVALPSHRNHAEARLGPSTSTMLGPSAGPTGTSSSMSCDDDNSTDFRLRCRNQKSPSHIGFDKRFKGLICAHLLLSTCRLFELDTTGDAPAMQQTLIKEHQKKPLELTYNAIYSLVEEKASITTLHQLAAAEGLRHKGLSKPALKKLMKPYFAAALSDNNNNKPLVARMVRLSLLNSAGVVIDLTGGD